MDLTLFDILIFGLITFFALIGLIRGFVREVFSITNWVAASITTIYLRPIITNIILQKINIPIVADLISNSFLFTTSLIIISIITSNLAKKVNGAFPAAINSPLGMVFGILKGFLLSSLIFVIILNIYGMKDSAPGWFTNSKVNQPLSLGASIIEPFTDSLFGSLSEKDTESVTPESDTKEDSETKRGLSGLMERVKETRKNINETQKTLKILQKYDDESYPPPEERTGYKEEEMKKMDRLINTISE